MKEVRGQYPQYQDMSDIELAAALHKKHYSDMPLSGFLKKVGVAQGKGSNGVPSFTQGLGDIFQGGGQFLSNILPEGVARYTDKVNNMLVDMGVPFDRMPEGGMDQVVEEREAEYQNARKSAGETGFDWGRLAGNILSTGPAAAAKIPQAASLLGKAATGSVGSSVGAGMMPVADGDYSEQKKQQMAIGGLLGAVIPGAGAGVARMVSPKTGGAVKQLIQEGVPVTPGQILGGWAKRAEEAGRSAPFLGDAITAAQTKGVESFNRAAIRRALKPVGADIADDAPVGYKAVESAYHTIGKAYDDLLPKLKIQADDAFNADMLKLKERAAQLHPSRAQQYETIIEQQVMRKFTDGGKMHPATMKEVDSQLGKMAASGMKSMDLDQQQLGAALREAQAALRDMVSRANPQYAPKLSKVNTAYANLLRVENAAARQGAKEGVFTPNQLEAATRALDSSLRKRKSSHGKALMQDLASMGDKSLTNKLANSGTADRMLWNLGGLMTGAVSPAIPASLMGASALYTPIAQKGLTGLLAKRPHGAEAMADIVRKAGAGAATLSGPASYSLFNQR